MRNREQQVQLNIEVAAVLQRRATAERLAAAALDDQPEEQAQRLALADRLDEEARSYGMSYKNASRVLLPGTVQYLRERAAKNQGLLCGLNDELRRHYTTRSEHET